MFRLLEALLGASLIPHGAATVSTAPYSEYILAPSSRTLTAPTVRQVNGTVKNAAALTGQGCTSLSTFVGNSSVTLDFGKNIAGTVHFTVDSVSGPNDRIGFTFTESSMWISGEYCDATQNAGLDGPLWFNLTKPGLYEADKNHQRGGFRYLSIVHQTGGNVTLGQLTVNWTASPDMEDPSAYAGYFKSDSEKLNRVWYAGAYTNQLCSIDPTTGDSLGLPNADWHYNFTIANGSSVLVDGGKRDRIVWPGDIAISGPSMFVSTNRLDPIRNGIDALLLLQQADGRLSWAGVPFSDYVADGEFLFSFTYHLHSLNDIYDYYMYTGDVDFLMSVWGQYKLALDYSIQSIDQTGLAYVNSSLDWLRSGMGGHNIEACVSLANSILYYTINNGLKLASALNDTSITTNWTTAASTIPAAANALLWDPTANLYRDNDTVTGFYPQDGNAWSIIAGIANATTASQISAALAARWVAPYGAPAPEAGATVISPFASGFEVQAHFLSGNADTAIALVEMMWADFMLDDPRMTNSTFIEGYSNDGRISYAPYSNDATISHAHGWSTGPTASLTFFAAGIMVTGAAGATWNIAPRMGGLGRVEAGFKTALGDFSVSWEDGAEQGLTGSFETPEGTVGELVLPVAEGCTTRVVLEGREGVREVRIEGETTVSMAGIPGGKYTMSPFSRHVSLDSGIAFTRDVFQNSGFSLWRSAATALPLTQQPSLLDISIAELGGLLEAGDITSQELVELYFQRISEVNNELHAVIELNPDASTTAELLDAERGQGTTRGPLHGIPILVKDNYATTDATLTGAGSVCLARSRPGQESTVVAKLRQAGAVILGKANLSEFSGVRGGLNVTEGWSPRGGQTFGAYVGRQTACGSSSGSGVAASLGLAAAALGTETSGSITCPARFNNVVGVKPTVGLTSRFGVVPVTARQDSTGPLAQSVADAALILDAIAGKDPNDNYTSAQPWEVPPSYTSALNTSALEGKRVGVVWVDEDISNAVDYVNREQMRVVFDEALADLEAAGAELVNIELGTEERPLRNTTLEILAKVPVYVGPDFKEAMARYIDDLVPGPDVIHNATELLQCLREDPLELSSEFDLGFWDEFAGINITAGSQEAWEAYVFASETARDLFVTPLREHHLDVLVMLPETAVIIASWPGLPIVTVPMGVLGDETETRWDSRHTTVTTSPGMPLGISFTADRWSEEELIGYAYAYEQTSHKRKELQPLTRPKSDLDTILWQGRLGAEL
ncbi:Uu.00g003440.m01.CDS01 [Anthostomella pinea]|uniref:Uu.00g003440.m01.CDS01 n=1 Tax=Anthostomella pinea TaxID=933095 RepID=A0AAI8VJT4_9PEZI|nr:Uu.00g003440.m01.CDS01 [Anthostomella pinea]